MRIISELNERFRRNINEAYRHSAHRAGIGFWVRVSTIGGHYDVKDLAVGEEQSHSHFKHNRAFVSADAGSFPFRIRAAGGQWCHQRIDYGFIWRRSSWSAGDSGPDGNRIEV
jgi:hypothetical protein